MDTDLEPYAAGSWAKQFEFDKPAQLSPEQWKMVTQWLVETEDFGLMVSKKTQRIIEALRSSENQPIRPESLFNDGTSRTTIVSMKKVLVEKSKDVFGDNLHLSLAVRGALVQLWFIRKKSSRMQR